MQLRETSNCSWRDDRSTARVCRVVEGPRKTHGKFAVRHGATISVGRPNSGRHKGCFWVRLTPNVRFAPVVDAITADGVST